MRHWLGILVIAGIALTACSRGGADDIALPPDMRMSFLPPLPNGLCGGVPTKGQCLDLKTVQACFVDSKGRAVISTVNCESGEQCFTEGDESFCKLTAACRNGQSRCTPAGFEQCVAGRWVANTCSAGTACQKFPGAGLECVPLGSSVTVTGQLQYQFRQPLSDYSGYDPTYYLANARGVFVLVAEAGKILGTAVADDFGRFTVPTYRAPGASAQLIFIPIVFDDSDTAVFAVARANSATDYSKSTGLWSFTVNGLPAPRAGKIDVGGRIVNGENAGALRVFDWMIFGRERAPDASPHIPLLSPPQLVHESVLIDVAERSARRTFAA